MQTIFGLLLVNEDSKFHIGLIIIILLLIYKEGNMRRIKNYNNLYVNFNINTVSEKKLKFIHV